MITSSDVTIALVSPELCQCELCRSRRDVYRCSRCGEVLVLTDPLHERGPALVPPRIRQGCPCGGWWVPNDFLLPEHLGDWVAWDYDEPLWP